MEPPFLVGQHPVTVDSRNRIAIPSAIRKRINPMVHGSDFIMLLGNNRKPWLYPDKFYEYVITLQKSELRSDPIQADFDRLTCAGTEYLELDANGRILIPFKDVEWMGIKDAKKLFLLGCRNHLELWEEAEWLQERESMPARSGEIERRLMEKRNQVVHSAPPVASIAAAVP